MSKILIVGDAMLDVSLHCEVTRLSPEAPIPIYDTDSMISSVGGAANVAVNAAALGAEVTLLCALGENSPLPQALAKHSIDVLTVPVQGHTVKQRVFVNEVMRARVDQDYILEEDESEQMVARFVDIFRAHDVIVFSDYAKGALRHVRDMLGHCSGQRTIVDPKGENWQKYTGASIIKGNATEVSSVYSERLALARRLGATHIIRTMGSAGSVATCWDGTDDIEVPAYPVYATDPTGAGDSYLAALAVALSTDGSDLRAAMLRASVAGALATMSPGTYPVDKEDLEVCLKQWLKNTSPR